MPESLAALRRGSRDLQLDAEGGPRQYELAHHDQHEEDDERQPDEIEEPQAIDAVEEGHGVLLGADHVGVDLLVDPHEPDHAHRHVVDRKGPDDGIGLEPADHQAVEEADEEPDGQGAR